MNPWLVAAATLTVGLVLFHSIAGEAWIIRKLVAQDQPQLFGSQAFLKRTVRGAWHAMTLLGIGLAIVMLLEPAEPVLYVMAATFVATALVMCVTTRGRHPSWIVLLIIAGLLLAA